MTELESKIVQLEAELKEARYNAQLGCPRRIVVERGWPRVEHATHALVFFDIDGLNALNADPDVGPEEVDRRISGMWNIIRSVMRKTEFLHGQWKSGDEFVIVVPHVAAKYVADRVQSSLNKVGITASISIVQADSDLVKTVQMAEYAMKSARGGAARGRGPRGVIVDVRNSMEANQNPTNTAGPSDHTDDIFLACHGDDIVFAVSVTRFSALTLNRLLGAVNHKENFVTHIKRISQEATSVHTKYTLYQLRLRQIAAQMIEGVALRVFKANGEVMLIVASDVFSDDDMERITAAMNEK